MKLSQLKKKYPKAFTQFNSFALYKYKNTKLNENRDVRAEWLNITDFMDKQGIIINISYYPFGLKWCYDIQQINNDTVNEKEDMKSRSQAETKAICKAFEILEGRL